MDIYDKYLTEIFVIQNADMLRKDLKTFLKNEFEKHDLKQLHAGISTTEFNSNEWLDSMSDNIANRLAQYFETMRSQTERDMDSPVPVNNNHQV